MRLSRLMIIAALPLAIVACEAEREPEVEPVAEPAAPAVPGETGMGAGEEVMVNMAALNNSNVTGQATVTPTGQQTQVRVQLNAQAAGTHQGHIHTGTCDSPGSVVQPLQPITTDATGSGSMTTTVSIDPMTVMDGQHIVVYHERAGNPGQPVVCGSIPQHTM